MLKRLLLAAALLVPGIAAADQTDPTHYHVGEVQIVVGPICNAREDAAAIMAGMDINQDKSIEVFKALFPSCKFLKPNLALILALEDRRSVRGNDGRLYSAILATIQSPTGRTYYMALTEVLPGKDS